MRSNYCKMNFIKSLCVGVTFVISSHSYSQCTKGDCENGIGIEKYDDGSSFEGQFENGSKKSGTITYASGSVYKGEFENNLLHGAGKFVYANGDIFEGFYEQNEKVYGGYLHSNGNKYFGEYGSNKPNGYGSYTLRDGTISEGFWVDGKCDFNIASDSIALTVDSTINKNIEAHLVSDSKFVNPKIYAVVVGIADYYSDMDLNYSDDDARIFYNHLLSAFPNETANGEVSLLLDHAATHSNIVDELERVFSKSSDNDYIMFYFSGHGGPGVFCPADYPSNLYHSEVKDAFKSANAKFRLCIADACHSGGIGESTGTPSYGDVQNLRDARLAVILSSTPDQVSMERASMKQGVFSYYLMQGLRGDGDLNGDSYVTAGELFIYTRDAVSRSSGGKQIPVIVGQQLHKIPLSKLK